jgi:hypothetical protein
MSEALNEKPNAETLPAMTSAGVTLNGGGHRAEPEDLRADRDLAQPADRGEPRVCVSRWLVVEAELGRRSAQRIAAGSDWRE